MPKPVLLRPCTISQSVLDDLGQDSEILSLPDAADPEALLQAEGARVQGVITRAVVGCPRDLMQALPNLEVVVCWGAGINQIDLETAQARGIRVTNTPDVLTDDVADLAIALMLAATRRVCRADRFVRSGQWQDGKMELGTKMTGRTLGIIGLGRIGQATARRAKGFDMPLLYTGPRRKPEVEEELGAEWRKDPESLARDCSILVLACPGGPDTAGIVDRQVLNALGPDGFLINVARGSVVVEADLVKALLDGRIAGAGLDTFADEPNVPEALFGLDNVVLQPHHASGTHETRAAMDQRVIENIRAHFTGAPLKAQVV